MTLFEKINNDLKNAMRGRLTFDLSVLRMLIGAVKNKKIELKQEEELTDEQIQAIVKSEIKKRKDSADIYQKGERKDLADKEILEIKLLEKYLPEQMSDEDLELEVRKTIASFEGASMKDFGKIMGKAMSVLRDKADGERVSKAIKKILTA